MPHHFLAARHNRMPPSSTIYQFWTLFQSSSVFFPSHMSVLPSHSSHRLRVVPSHIDRSSHCTPKLNILLTPPLPSPYYPSCRHLTHHCSSLSSTWSMSSIIGSLAWRDACFCSSLHIAPQERLYQDLLLQAAARSRDTLRVGNLFVDPALMLSAARSYQ